MVASPERKERGILSGRGPIDGDQEGDIRAALAGGAEPSF